MTVDIVPHDWVKIAEQVEELVKLIIIPALVICWKHVVLAVGKFVRGIVCEENDKQLDKFNGRYVKTELFTTRVGGIDTVLSAVQTKVEQLADDSRRREHQTANTVGTIAAHLDFLRDIAEGHAK